MSRRSYFTIPQRREYTEVFNVPQYLMGMIIGTKGANIQRAKDIKGVTSVKAVKHEDNYTFTVRGETKMAVKWARYILDLHQKPYFFPKFLEGHMLGRYGRNMSDIVNKSLVDRLVLEEEKHRFLIQIIGNPEKIEKAKILLDHLIQTYEGWTGTDENNDTEANYTDDYNEEQEYFQPEIMDDSVNIGMLHNSPSLDTNIGGGEKEYQIRNDEVTEANGMNERGKHVHTLKHKTDGVETDNEFNFYGCMSNVCHLTTDKPGSIDTEHDRLENESIAFLIKQLEPAQSEPSSETQEISDHPIYPRISKVKMKRLIVSDISKEMESIEKSVSAFDVEDDNQFKEDDSIEFDIFVFDLDENDYTITQRSPTILLGKPRHNLLSSYVERAMSKYNPKKMKSNSSKLIDKRSVTGERMIPLTRNQRRSKCFGRNKSQS